MCWTSTSAERTTILVTTTLILLRAQVVRPSTVVASHRLDSESGSEMKCTYAIALWRFLIEETSYGPLCSANVHWKSFSDIEHHQRCDRKALKKVAHRADRKP
ncbi:hypothetical protein BC832DRAFT_159462 [Gaertneriomyces semiglobifer]|nr:hypothetical protein BC832DRAFT_159462 [Gaertneriomyces semiglobifer]